MDRRRDWLTGAAWTLVWIRLVFWAGAALTVLWVPLRHDFPPFGAYDARSDLVFGAVAQWDAGWYVHIADVGYDSRQATAFFPLYPLAVHAVDLVLRSTIVAGTLLSLAAAAVAAVLVGHIARPLVGAEGARDTVLYIALYPIAYVFTSVYSEALFLALAAGSFLAATRNRPWLAGLLGGLAVVTRPVGIALIPPLVFLLRPRGRSPGELLRLLPVLLLPAALGAYMLYLDHRFDDPLVFQSAQGVFWLRHTPELGPLGGLWDAVSAGWHGAVELARHLPRYLGAPSGYPRRDVFATWNVVHLLLLGATLWLTWVAWRRLGPALGLYAVSTDLVVLSTSVDVFPLASYPRYVLVNFPLFIALAAVTRERPRAREAVLVGFGAVGLVAAAAFAHHIWIA